MYRHLLREGELTFPPGFLFGAATAAYQVEGGANAGGRGPSIWDTFAHTPGMTVDGATGDVATDHYHRVDSDLDLMKSLNLPSYRFSISWSRVIPDGDGEVNKEGLAFYRHLVEGLRARGIAPIATLNHWDLPQALEERFGGWRGRETCLAFERYAEIMGSALGDHVAIWSTHNEPWNSSFAAYGSGAFAPGGRSHADALKAAHHLNLAHGLAVKALRRTVRNSEAKISIVLNIFRVEAMTHEDAEAARRFDAVANRIFTGPLLRGQYPQDLLADTRGFTDWSFVQPGDVEMCHQPIDLLGLNYHEVVHVRSNPLFQADIEALGGTRFPGSERVLIYRPKDVARTGMDWAIEPRGLEEHLVALSAEFPGLPIMVMENGAAFPDAVLVEEGRLAVRDVARTRFLAAHVEATHRALARGANVVGYLVWSLLDNFEWTQGYGPRFGIVRVDYPTLARTPKLSAEWFASLCATNTVPRLEVTSGQP